MSVTPFESTAVNPSLIQLSLTGVSTIFNSVSGFSITLPTQRYQQRASTGQTSYLYRSGEPEYGDLTCTSALSATDTSMFDWWNKMIGTTTPAPLDGTLMLYGPDGSVSASFTLTGVFLQSLEVSSQTMDQPGPPTVTSVLSCISYSRLS